MAAKHPLFDEWSRRRFKAAIIDDIWPGILFFTLVATVVTLVSEMTEHQLSLSSTMLTVLGTVLGLVISFRTSSAYERYMEGRKLWTTISLASRSIAQFIWVHVPFEYTDKENNRTKKGLEVVIEKKSMINLVHAFSVSVKHLLRGEPGVCYEDLGPLVYLLPRYATYAPKMAPEDVMLPLSDGSGSQRQNDSEKDLKHLTEEPMLRSLRYPRPSLPIGYSGNPTISDPEAAIPIVETNHPLGYAPKPPMNTLSEDSTTTEGKEIHRQAVDSNVPLEITLYLSSYLAYLLKNKLLESAIAVAFTNGISQLQDTVTNLDRVRDTPLPFAYQVHLRVSVWLYLFFLPCQLWSSFHYLTIPATAFASFFLLGFLEIGQEIENPFDNDPNDLDMDSFCQSIERELHQITAHSCLSPYDYLLTSRNLPFVPSDERTADEMMKTLNHPYHDPDTGMHSIFQTLHKSWRVVEQSTRK